MRDDSLLYTGTSSSSFSSAKDRELKDKRKERSKELQSRRTQLRDSGEVLVAEITREVLRLRTAPYPNEDTMSDEQFRAERKGRKIAIETLVTVQNRLINLLREPIKKDDKEPVWGEDES